MVVTAIALALIGQQPGGLDTPVKVEVKNSTLPGLMEEMEKQTGVKIHVQGAPREDFVFAKFNKRSLRSSLDVLAKLCEARWAVSSGEVYFSAAWPPDADAGLEAREQAIRDWLEKNPVPEAMTKEKATEVIEETLKLQKSQLPNARNAGNKLFQLTPTPRAHMRLIHALGAEELASIPSGETRVYMMSGKERVRSLPGSASGIMRDLVSERDFYKGQLGSLGLGTEQFSGGTYFPAIQSYSPTQLAETDWMLLVHNQGYEMQTELRGFGDTGSGRLAPVSNNTIAVAPTYVDLSQSQGDDEFTKIKDPYTVPESWKQLFSPAPSPQALPTPTDALVQRLENLDKDEVLTDFAHDPLLKLSEAKNAEVAAIVPDMNFFSMVYGALPRATDLGSALRASFMNEGKMEVHEGVYLLSPKGLRESRLARVPRSAAAAYIRAGLKHGQPDVDIAADLAVAAIDDSALTMALAVANVAIDNNVNDMYSFIDVLRLYGHLNPSQRKEAKEEGLALNFRNLNKAQQEILKKLLNGSSAGLASPDQPRSIEESTKGGWNLEDMIQLRLPVEVPANTVVRFDLDERSKMFGQYQHGGGRRSVNVVNLDILALQQAQTEMGWDTGSGKMLGVTYADRTFLQVTLDFGDLGYLSKTLPIGSPAKDAKFVPIDQMASETREEFEKKLDAFREQLKQTVPGGGGRRTPPP